MTLCSKMFCRSTANYQDSSLLMTLIHFFSSCFEKHVDWNVDEFRGSHFFFTFSCFALGGRNSFGELLLPVSISRRYRPHSGEDPLEKAAPWRFNFF